MSVAIVPELALSTDRKRWTRDEVSRLVEAGLLADQRYELIEGELIGKMGQKPPHAYVIRVLNDILTRRFGGRRVQIQLPIQLPEPMGERSEPEPDVVLLHRDNPEFLSRHPGPDDVALLIEVSDTTLDRDRGAKYKLYALSEISEYWILDLQNRRVIVCRRPDGDEYRSVEIFASSEALTPLAAPGLTLTLDSLLV